LYDSGKYLASREEDKIKNLKTVWENLPIELNKDKFKCEDFNYSLHFSIAYF
jgi:hypothetical protein